MDWQNVMFVITMLKVESNIWDYFQCRALNNKDDKD